MAEWFDPQIGLTIDLLRYAENVVVLTGAGISTASGINDFRSPGGLWEKYNPLKYANYNVFLKKPEYYWELERELVPIFASAKPNRAHKALVEMERKLKGSLKVIITQNIDNFHQMAGTKVPVIEIHGNVYRVNCMDCHKPIKRGYILKKFKEGAQIPECPYCGGRVKPDVLLFQEPIGDALLDEAIQYAEKCDVFMVLGSSLMVFPANQLPIIAKRNKKGAKVVHINQTPTIMDKHCSLRLLGDLATILPAIVEKL
jgi:NAD-dependent deacetylase